MPLKVLVKNLLAAKKRDPLLSRKTDMYSCEAKFDVRVAGRLSGRRAAWRRQGRREKEEDVWRADD
jgi:hypothetical protein